MKKTLLLLVSCVLLLTGCSSGGSVNITWDNGTIKNGNTVLNVDVFQGDQCIATMPTGAKATCIYETCTDLSYAQWNIQGVTEDNMDKFKNSYYWSRSLGTETIMHIPAGDQWYKSLQCIDSDGNMPAPATMYETLNSLPLTNTPYDVKIGDKLVMYSQYGDLIKVTPSAVSIPGVINVKVGSNDNAVTPVVLTVDKKEITLMSYSSNKYTYYNYEGYVIQTAIGINVTDYIKFK